MAPKRVHQLCRGWDEGTVSGAEIVAELRSMLDGWTPKSIGTAGDGAPTGADSPETDTDAGDDPEGSDVGSGSFYLSGRELRGRAGDEYDSAIDPPTEQTHSEPTGREAAYSTRSPRPGHRRRRRYRDRTEVRPMDGEPPRAESGAELRGRRNAARPAARPPDEPPRPRAGEPTSRSTT